MNEATGIGKLFIICGIILVVIGTVLLFAGKIPFIGKLPGDIVIRKGNFSFYFPVVTSIVVSLILTLIFFLISRFKQ
ncbi:MAG TPA: DUF2905 domain-containing protein [Chitinophagales bacterium]|nr:DUF2905 domain-containing protein [Chitinophagales bacterium]